jgi:hypothetical protein
MATPEEVRSMADELPRMPGTELAQRPYSRGQMERTMGHVPPNPAAREAYHWQRLDPDTQRAHDRDLAELAKRAHMGLISYNDVSDIIQRRYGGNPAVRTDDVMRERSANYYAYRPERVGNREKDLLNWPRPRY